MQNLKKEEKDFTSTLYTNDNLFVLTGLNSNLVDLIYLDPPFNTEKVWSAPIGSKAAGTSFKDMWTWSDVNDAYLDKLVEKHPSLVMFIKSISQTHSKAMMAYIVYMTQRIIEMHRVLKDTGSIYLHCDPTASHYLKIVMDEIFGRDNFRNEIIWFYPDTPGRSNKYYPAKHDIILFYTKNKDYFFYPNAVRVPILEASKQRYKSVRKLGGKEYLGGESAEIGKIPEDVWRIPTVKKNSREATKYPTQKPLALLHRIINGSSKEGDIVLDPFCGCATTCVAAQKTKRKWIGIDISKNAASILVDRLTDDAGFFKDFIHTAEIPTRTDIKIEPITISIKDRLFKQQNGCCNGCLLDFNSQNLEVDHIIPKSKGGGDYFENYQLLCPNCNKIKGDRPMEYLLIKIDAREKLLKEKLSFGR